MTKMSEMVKGGLPRSIPADRQHNTTAVAPRQPPGQLLKVNGKHNWKMKVFDIHFWEKSINVSLACPATFPAIRLSQTCQITWIHPVLTQIFSFRSLVLQGLLIPETKRKFQVLISPPFQHVPQMDMTAVCIWQIKSGKWTCCVCTQPVLEPKPWGCIESRFTKWVKRKPATNSCAKLLSVWSPLFSSLIAVL